MRRYALVVDDEPLIATLIRSALASADFDVEVAHDAATASSALAELDVDVAILDVSLGRGSSGVDLAHLTHASYPATAILMLTRFPDRRTTEATLGTLPPTCGFLSKTDVTDTEVLLTAVESVLLEHPSAEKYPTTPLSPLTPVQLSVLHLVAQGFSSAEIARRRGCSTSAVEKILGTIYRSLGIDPKGPILPRVEAVRIYAATTVLPPRTE